MPAGSEHGTSTGSPEGARPSPALPLGLLIPWVVLVVTGLLGVVLLPALGQRLFEIEIPSALEGWLAGLLPVLVAGAIGALLVRRPDRLGPLRSLRIPAGDLLVPVEALLRRIPQPDQEAAVARGRALVRDALAAMDPVVEVVRTAARRDLHSIQGPLLGVLITLLAGVLFVLLQLQL